MKEMNRREFLTLTGAAVVALSLAGCGGGPSAPAVPTSKEAELVAAINKVWKKKYDVKATFFLIGEKVQYNKKYKMYIGGKSLCGTSEKRMQRRFGKCVGHIRRAASREVWECIGSCSGISI